MVFEHAEKFALKSGRERGDFIEEKCAMMREFDTAFFGGAGAGKCAFLITKQLRFH